jgi:hypothetical protein
MAPKTRPPPNIPTVVVEDYDEEMRKREEVENEKSRSSCHLRAPVEIIVAGAMEPTFHCHYYPTAAGGGGNPNYTGGKFALYIRDGIH